MAAPTDLSALRTRCEAVIGALALPNRVVLDDLFVTVGARRQRGIVFLPVHGQAVPCGMWVAAESRDYIFYESDTSPLHQAHIKLHELAHLLLGHHSAQVVDVAFVQNVLPDLSSQVLESVLRRATYATPEERGAELLASLLLARLSPAAPAPADPVTESARKLLGRSLEFPAETS